MIEFAPNSPWPKRIKVLMYVCLGFVLLSAVISTVGGYWAKSQGSEQAASTRVKMQAIAFAIGNDFDGKYPKTRDELARKFEPPHGLPKFLRRISLRQLFKQEPLEDAWKRDFRYLCPGVHNIDSYDLWSVGEDGKDGTKDDITNW